MNEVYGIGYVNGALVEWVLPLSVPKPKAIIDTDRMVYSFFRYLTFGPHKEEYYAT